MKLIGEQVKFAKLMIGNMVWACCDGETYSGVSGVPVYENPHKMNSPGVSYFWLDDGTPFTILDATTARDGICYKVLFKAPNTNGMQTGWVMARRTSSSQPPSHLPKRTSSSL